MATIRKTEIQPINRLLTLLPRREYERLQPHLHRIPLKYRQSLYKANNSIGFVYFIVGFPLVLGDDRAPTSVYVQVPGAGLRMTATLFKRELARSASMRAVMLRYAHAFFN